MSSNTQGYVDEDGLTTKDVRVIVSAFKAMDTENLPIPDYELMSKVYPWKWPSNNAKSEMCRLKSKMKGIQAKLKATHSTEPGEESNAGKQTDAKFKVTKKPATREATTKKTAAKKTTSTKEVTPEVEDDEDSKTRNDDDIVEDIVEDIADEVVRYIMDNAAAQGC